MTSSKKVSVSASTSASPSTSTSISDWEASVSLAKAIMGAGSFALPWAFMKMGYIAGPIFMTLFLVLSVHSIGLLVECSRWMRRQQQQQRNYLRGTTSASSSLSFSFSYVDVARSTFGPSGAALTYAASISASIGVCGSYLVFIAVNLESLLLSSSSSSSSIIMIVQQENKRVVLLVIIWMIAMPIAVMLSSVRNAKRFAAVSLWGDVSVVAGMIAVLVYGVIAATTTMIVEEEGQQSNSTTTTATTTRGISSGCVAVGSLSDMALAFGSIGYLFLVHFLVLPIESSMQVNEDDGDGNNSEGNAGKNRFNKVVSRTFAVCGGIGGFFGIAGYMLFGADTQQIVLLNVKGGVGMAAVQFLLCIDLLLTYPVVMRPSIFILEQQLLRRRQRHRQRHRHIMRKLNSSTDDTSTVEVMLSSSAVAVTTASSSCNKRNAATATVVDSADNNIVTSSLISLTSAASFEIGIPASDDDGDDKLLDDLNNDDNNNNSIDDDDDDDVVEWKTHVIVCLTLGVVAASAGSFVPAFGLLSGLVGGVSQTFLAFVLPPLMWAKQRGDRRQLLNAHVQTSTGRQEHHIWSQQQQQQQFNAWTSFCILPWKEKTLVLCGFGLILWTLHSAWTELGGE